MFLKNSAKFRPCCSLHVIPYSTRISSSSMACVGFTSVHVEQRSKVALPSIGRHNELV